MLIIVLMDDELPHGTAWPSCPPNPEGSPHKASHRVVSFSDLNVFAGLELRDEGRQGRLGFLYG